MEPLGERLYTYGTNWLEVIRWFFLGGLVVLCTRLILGTNDGLLSDSVILYGGIFLFLLIALVLALRPKQIVLYEQGIGTIIGRVEKSWHWNEITSMSGTRYSHSLNGIPMLRYGANYFYAGPEKAFSVSYMTVQSTQLVEFIRMKMTEMQIPRVLSEYQQGTKLNFGNIQLDQSGLGGRNQWIPWADIKGFRFRGQNLWIDRHSKPKSENLGQPEARYMLVGILDSILGTDLFLRMQMKHLRGPKRWFGIPRSAVLLTLVATGILAVVFGGIYVYREFNNWQQQSARTELATKYGNDITTLCSSAQNVSGKLSKPFNKYIVVDMDNAWIHRPFQDMLQPTESAATRQDLSALVCLKASCTRVEQCYYKKDGKFDFAVDRYESDFAIALMDVKTSKTVTTGILRGGEPAPCPDTAQFGEADIIGPAPTPNTFADWLRQVNLPNDSGASA
ncbi:MAG: DUF6585 family protein [Chloroflexota bacterium]